MRKFLAKLAVVSGVGIAALAVPATAFASTTGTPTPGPTPTVTQNTHPGNWNKGDDNKDKGKGNDWNKGRDNNRDCKPEVKFFSNTQSNDRNKDWRNCRPTQGHNPVRCLRCVVQSVFFNVRKGSTHFTEVSGPTLVSGELLKYNHVTYTVHNVSGRWFQLFQAAYGPIHANASHFWAKATTVCPKVIHRPVSWNVWNIHH